MQVIKNKKFTKSLIALVIILWVVIMVKLFIVTSEKPGKISHFVKEPETNNVSRKPDTLKELKILKEDPFGMKKKKRTSIPKQKLPGEINIPTDIKYLGYMQSGTRGEKMANINYRNQFKVKSENDTIEKYRLIRVFEDSILISLENSKFYIKRSQ